MRGAACGLLQIGCKPETPHSGHTTRAGVNSAYASGVLGPLEVSAEGQLVDVAGPIPRRLAAIASACRRDWSMSRRAVIVSL
jgi:hypothetical protein